MTDTSTLQKALITIKKLKQLVQAQKNSFEPIAIIGLSCRFPGANNKDEYWDLLAQGKNTIGKLSEERWQLLKGTAEPQARDEKHPYWGGYLQDIAAFDSYFFGITPREAMRMDPQQRLLLEVAYEAFEDAGVTPEKLAGSNTGVFTSLYASQFGHLQTLETDLDALYIPTGNAISIAANRLSYLFDLRGPSLVLDTACSSSLIATHLACLNLQNNLCDLALVCGANINLLPSINSLLAKAKMLSPDGQCKTFDADANGYVQGEGIGVIVLKPLAKALQDKDRIYSVITGSAINQDGKTNGLTAPNGLQQEKLLQAAYAAAKVNPADISYLECHGTGTFLGDPIELQAVGEVVGKTRHADAPCIIGSVKTNIGHLEPAAGMASIIKVALSLHKSKIPPHLNYATPNPHINFDKYHLKVADKLQDWPKYGESRVAGVSGFGFGGSNAHVVIREVSTEEMQTPVHSTLRREIFTISAKEPAALKSMIDAWCNFIDKNPKLNLSQLCYNLHLRRAHYANKLAIVADSIAELYNALCLAKENSSHHSQTIFLSSEHKESSSVTDYSDPVLVAKGYVNDAKIDWDKYEETRKFTYLDMPLYAWLHKNYWPALENQQEVVVSDHLFRGKQVLSPLPEMQFEFRFDTKAVPDILDTFNILHAGYYLEMLAFAVNKIGGKNTFTVENLIFSAPIIVTQNTVVKVQLVLEKGEAGQFHFSFYSVRDDDKWQISTTGVLHLQTKAATKIDSIETIKQRSKSNDTAEKFYTKVKSMRMPGDGSIRWTDHYWANEQEILCAFRKPETIGNETKLNLKIHFGVVDACIQGLFGALPEALMKPFVASKIDKLTFFGGNTDNLYLLSTLNSIQPDGKGYSGNWFLFNANGNRVAECENLTMTQLSDRVQIADITQSDTQARIDLAALPPQERKQTVLNYLVDQTATLFSMPKTDVNVNQSLRDMGIDSLMALVFIRALESAFGETYSLEMILEGPTLVEISDRVLLNKVVQSNKPVHSWIGFRQAQANAKVKLFCFPYGGGGASIYRQWQRELPETIEVCPIQLPGREDRMDEVPINNINELISLLIDHLQPEMTMPFAFWGHSFGSLVGFELARQLRKQNLAMPMHLFVSAYPEPRLPTRSLDNLLLQLGQLGIDLFSLNDAALTALSDKQLNDLLGVFNQNGVIEYNQQTMNRDVLKMLLPIFIADMSIVKSYRYTHEAELPLPISVFMGTQDTFVLPEDILGWPMHTQQHCQIHKFDSGHLFMKDESIRKMILRQIQKELVVGEVVC